MELFSKQKHIISSCLIKASEGEINYSRPAVGGSAACLFVPNVCISGAREGNLRSKFTSKNC